MARCNAKFCELTDAKFEVGEYFRTHQRAMTERADTAGLVEMQLIKLGRFELFGQESVGRRAFSVSLLNDTSAYLLTSLGLKLQTT